MPGGRLTVINNGSAGMANFAGLDLRADLAHRDAAFAASRRSTASCATAYSSTRSRSNTTSRRFLTRFSARWPDGSAARTSYYQRIVNGPAYTRRASGGARALRSLMLSDRHPGPERSRDHRGGAGSARAAARARRRGDRGRWRQPRRYRCARNAARRPRDRKRTRPRHADECRRGCGARRRAAVSPRRYAACRRTRTG